MDAPSIPGGSAGLPGEEETHKEPQQRATPRNEPERKAKQYMVTNGPRSHDGLIPFTSEGYMVHLRPGKIVTEATHDLALMRRQGITLEPMQEQTYDDSLLSGQEAIARGQLDDEGDAAQQPA